MTNINKLIIVPELDVPTPARVHRPSGTVYINSSIFDKYSAGEQKIILEHELGHYVLQTTSEEKADLYALQKTAGTFDKSIRTFVDTFVKTLDLSIPQNRNRIHSAIIHGAIVDYKKFGNKKSLNILQNIYGMNKRQIDTYIPEESDVPATDINSFTGDTDIMDWLQRQKRLFFANKNITEDEFDNLTEDERLLIIIEFSEIHEVSQVLKGYEIHIKSQEQPNTSVLDDHSNAGGDVTGSLGPDKYIGMGVNLFGSLFSSKKAQANAQAAQAAADLESQRLALERERMQMEAENDKGPNIAMIAGIGGGVVLVLIVMFNSSLNL